MHRGGDHAVGDLGVAVRDGDRVLLVERQHDLRRAVAEIVDDAVVQPAVGRAGHERYVGDLKLAQHRRDRVGAPDVLALAGGDGGFGEDTAPRALT